MAKSFTQSILPEKLATAGIEATFTEIPQNNPFTDPGPMYLPMGDRERITCSTVLKDILDRPAIEFTISQPSQTVGVVTELLGLTRMGMAATGAVLALIICLLMQKMVLGRLLNLRGQVTGIAGRPEKESYVTLKGDDELSWLAFDISRLLRQLNEQERMNHHILKSLRLGILLVDRDTHRVEEVNPFFLDLVDRKGGGPQSTRRPMVHHFGKKRVRHRWTRVFRARYPARQAARKSPSKRLFHHLWRQNPAA